MQKWKNILGSRKKGAQEPHAAREPRYDYQGNTTSNLKGISLECLTLPVGVSSYLCPLLYSSSIADLCLTVLIMCVCALFCFVFFVWIQRARSSRRTSPGAWGTWPSIWTRKALPCSSSSLTNRWVKGNVGILAALSCVPVPPHPPVGIFKSVCCGLAGRVHPEPRRHHAEHWEHHSGAGLYIPAAGSHGQGAGGDRPEVRRQPCTRRSDLHLNLIKKISMFTTTWKVRTQISSPWSKNSTLVFRRSIKSHPAAQLHHHRF